MKKKIREQLKELIGQEVTIYIDRPIGTRHTKYKDIVYPINYGYIKEIIAADNEYQDAYLIGVEETVEVYKGKVYVIIERENDNEDKLIIVPKNMGFSIEEIKEKIDFQEKYFRYKIVK